MELHLNVGRLAVHLHVEWEDPEETPGLQGLDSAEQIAALVGDAWEEEPAVRDAAADARRSIKALQAAVAEAAEAQPWP